MSVVEDPRFPHLGGNPPGGDRATFCPALWKWLVEKHEIKRVLDVGCGEGHALAEFKKLGCETLGLDGLSANVEKRPKPAVVHDLTTGPFSASGYDLIWCCEVVEHVEEGKCGHLLDLLSQGRVLAMTHATPGQSGHHHVNCQPQEYWINLMSERGMRLSAEDTEEGRRRCPGDNHFGRHGLIFHKEAK